MESRALSPLAEAGHPWHGEQMRSSLAWGKEQCPEQQQLPLETGREVCSRYIASPRAQFLQT